MARPCNVGTFFHLVWTHLHASPAYSEHDTFITSYISGLTVIYWRYCDEIDFVRQNIQCEVTPVGSNNAMQCRLQHNVEPYLCFSFIDIHSSHRSKHHTQGGGWLWDWASLMLTPVNWIHSTLLHEIHKLGLSNTMQHNTTQQSSFSMYDISKGKMYSKSPKCFWTAASICNSVVILLLMCWPKWSLIGEILI